MVLSCVVVWWIHDGCCLIVVEVWVFVCVGGVARLCRSWCGGQVRLSHFIFVSERTVSLHSCKHNQPCSSPGALEAQQTVTDWVSNREPHYAIPTPHHTANSVTILYWLTRPCLTSSSACQTHENEMSSPFKLLVAMSPFFAAVGVMYQAGLLDAQPHPT